MNFGRQHVTSWHNQVEVRDHASTQICGSYDNDFWFYNNFQFGEDYSAIMANYVIMQFFSLFNFPLPYFIPRVLIRFATNLLLDYYILTRCWCIFCPSSDILGHLQASTSLNVKISVHPGTPALRTALIKYNYYESTMRFLGHCFAIIS